MNADQQLTVLSAQAHAACRAVSRLVRHLPMIAALLAVVASGATAGEPPVTGSVEGRVQNAVTRDALNNARVSVRGTNISTLTDEGGRYILPAVPAGQVNLDFSFTGLDAKTVTATVAAGQSSQVDVALTSRTRYGAADETVRLDQFVVESTRETNASTIAVNEQRVAGNIKSVVSADEFGTIVDRNPGELLKYLPGIDVEYFANNITGISVRGLGADNTEINFDGMPVASMNAESVGRAMEIQYMSAADIARVEVRKLPLPEDSSNAIGGSINMVRRSAFESTRRKISYRALLRADGEKLTLDKIDGPKDRLMDRWRPNWDITWTEPVTHDFGFVLNFGRNDTIVNTHWSVPGWNLGSTANDAAFLAGTPNIPSLYNPALRNPLNHNAPKGQGKDYASLRIDWRPLRELTLGWSGSVTKGWVQNADDIRYRWDTAATGSGNATRFNDATTSLGRPGGGAAYHDTPLWRDVLSPTVSTSMDAQWRSGRWEARLIGGWSESRYQYFDMEHGFFGSTTAGGVTGLVNIPQTGVGAGTANPIPLTIDFRDVDYWRPKTIQAFTTATGATSTNIADYTVPVDWASNSVTRIGGTRSRPAFGKEIVTAGRAYVRRHFQFTNPLAVQIGGELIERYRNRQYPYYTWRFVGADGVPNTADDASTQIAAVALRPRRDSEYDYPGSERVSMTRLYKLYQDHPDWFKYDTARSERLSRTSNPAYDLREKTKAGYVQFDWNLFHNRLRLLGGVRYERSDAVARGLLSDNDAAYMKYANGQIVHAGDLDANGAAMVVNRGSSTSVNYQLANAASVLPATVGGAPVFVPEVQQAGNAARAAGETTDSGTNLGRGTLAHTLLVYTPKGATGSGGNDGYYPSLHATYVLRDNLLLRFGYARTQAKLDYNDVLIPGTTTEDDLITSGVGAGAIGRISVHNTDLKPWTADNFDARIEYYSAQGGFIGLGVFTKRVQDIIVQEDTTPLTQQDIDALNARFPNLSLEPSAVNYTLRTSYNEGSARMDGAELELRQSLDPWLGKGAARGFMLIGSSTYTNRKGPNSNDLGTNRAWLNKLSLSYNRPKFSAFIGYTMNGEVIENPLITANGVNGKQIRVRQNLIDIRLSYAIAKWVRLFAEGNDITDERRAREQVYPGRPHWGSMTSSNTFGVTYTVGLTGSF